MDARVLEDLRAQAGGDPKVERWLNIALRNARRLLRLTNQILDVAKLEAGQMRLAPLPLDLVPFTRGLAAAFATIAERKEIRLTVEAPDALVGAFDPDALEKILTNLLSNAIKFTPADGTVSVVLSGEQEQVTLVVRDSGPGIPADQLPHIFERFYQVDESHTRTQIGTGIGLSLVKELVDLHGGRVTVESGRSGTSFLVTLPWGHLDGVAATDLTTADPGGVREAGPLALLVAAEQDGKADAALSAVEDPDIPTLLVVDDSEDLRAYIRGHFEDRFLVLEAGDGAEGIEIARRRLPDVVLSDVMMPGTGGHELVRALRASPETDFLSIILLTAQSEDKQKIAGLEHGADDYMVKPFEMRELDVRVRNLIASRRRMRARFAPNGVEPRRVEPRPVGEGLPPGDRAVIDRVRTAIEERLSDPDFGVAELADAVAADRSHLSRRIRHLLGETPTELIRRLRLEEGERLLTRGTGTVADVAYSVGFNSVSYFCRCFQEKYGTTPAAYRGQLVPPHG